MIIALFVEQIESDGRTDKNIDYWLVRPLMCTEMIWITTVVIESKEIMCMAIRSTVNS